MNNDKLGRIMGLICPACSHPLSGPDVCEGVPNCPKQKIAAILAEPEVVVEDGVEWTRVAPPRSVMWVASIGKRKGIVFVSCPGSNWQVSEFDVSGASPKYWADGHEEGLHLSIVAATAAMKEGGR